MAVPASTEITGEVEDKETKEINVVRDKET